MTAAEDPQIPVDEWDWMAELARQERDRMWLARKMGVNYRRVYHYAAGTNKAPLDWLAAAARVLGVTLAGLPATERGTDR